MTFISNVSNSWIHTLRHGRRNEIIRLVTSMLNRRNLSNRWFSSEGGGIRGVRRGNIQKAAEIN